MYPFHDGCFDFGGMSRTIVRFTLSWPVRGGRQFIVYSPVASSGPGTRCGTGFTGSVGAVGRVG
ncbi:hypothetical protein D7231_32795 [Streptomyces klenkii]|uniref:Uncharacterized protein n=1 Tax=Streptomyces klenkii TaxID=1420899 RepID=A0A3B0AJL7_9ACTN|nr:hypothetical protein D7231_32795 [Streptomyces klenkii]